MDMREIEQLHAQYAQPTLTIDISHSPARTAPSQFRLGNGTSASGADGISASTGGGKSVTPRALWAVVFAVGAAAMFLIGSSMGKRDARGQNAQPSAVVSAPEPTPAAPIDAQSSSAPHAWPVRTDAASAAAAVPRSATATPASVADTAKITLPPQEPPKVSSPPPKAAAASSSAPAKAAAPIGPAQSPRPAVSQEPASARDIKLF
ncbi:hypothetical protein [Cupriavidus pauculus]|uniref:hypothetical protein n=1 Tax=Cupriavidus pauculus TaxID=82633 RepID=UPI0007860811|nr:hypothetical protein [Cupriavidus pauculus]